MATPANNLFLRLHKWASRQDENFLTESLAIVLEQLLVLAPVVGTRLVAQLTGGFLDVPPEEASTIEIQTQVEAEGGRPDLEIGTRDRLVWVEVKAEAELRVGQLEGYRVLLSESKFDKTYLVLLTRYQELFRTQDERPDLEVRWFEIADWLENELPALAATSDVANFLARQFLDFLEARGMTLVQVEKYMPDGVRALSNLMNMLYEAASACKVSVKKKGAWGYMGVHLDDEKYGASVDFTEPEKLWFGTRCPIDVEKASKLDAGELQEVGPGRYRWWRGIDLDSEDVHFYARSKVGQMRWLVDFLTESMKMAHSITTGDQPQFPEEPEGN